MSFKRTGTPEKIQAVTPVAKAAFKKTATCPNPKCKFSVTILADWHQELVNCPKCGATVHV